MGDRPEVLSETIHNLAKSSQTDGLWLLDNESGLLDAYALLYPSPEKGLDAEREAIRFRAMQTDLPKQLAYSGDKWSIECSTFTSPAMVLLFLMLLSARLNH